METYLQIGDNMVFPGPLGSVEGSLQRPKPDKDLWFGAMAEGALHLHTIPTDLRSEMDCFSARNSSVQI